MKIRHPAILNRLYWEKKKSLSQIAMEAKVCHKTVLNWMRKYGIPRRTRSQALMRYPKKPFSNDLIEKAYLLGLRAGDVSATPHRNQVQVIVGTTHPAQIKMFESAFMGYGHVSKYPYRQDNRCRWYVHSLLDKSFSFLIKKA